MSSKAKAIHDLRNIIRYIISESEGKLKLRSTKGSGAHHPYYQHSSRKSLGKEENYRNSIDDEDIEIIISRAFKK